MAAAPRAEGRLLLLAVILCLCCSPVTCKRNKTPWKEKLVNHMMIDYNSYAKKEGNPKTMNCNEFSDYLKEWMASFLEGKDPDIVEKTLATLDENKDGELDYDEFFQFFSHSIVSKYKANNQLRQ